MPRKHRRPSDFVTCKHCGKKLRAIGYLHLRNLHGYDGEHPVLDYKAKFGIPFAMSKGTRKKISEAKETFWDERGQHWTPKDVLAEIRRIHRAGRSLRSKQVPVRLYEAGRRVFGTWEAALEKAGLNYEETTGIRHWNRDKVIKRIQQLAAEGVPLNATHVEENYPYLHRAAVRHFPISWGKALRAAGFDPDEHKVPRGNWDRQSAEKWVQERLAKGKSILGRDAPRDLQDFVRNRLGMNWTGFVESLGIPYPGVKHRRDWTKAKLVAEIRRWKKEGNRTNYRAVADNYQALIHQARKYFGSWDKARAAAGV